MRHRAFPLMLALALWLPLAHAAAQTTGSTTTSTTTSTGAFAQLSPGNQKVASAIFAAQSQSTGTGTTAGTGTTSTGSSSTLSKPLTLDQIAQRKVDGQGWGEIYKSLKEQGLVTYKNLGLAMSAYNHSHHPTSGTGVVTTGSGRTMRQDGGGYDAYERRGGDDGHGSAYNAGHGNSGGSGGGNASGHVK